MACNACYTCREIILRKNIRTCRNFDLAFKLSRLQPFKPCTSLYKLRKVVCRFADVDHIKNNLWTSHWVWALAKCQIGQHGLERVVWTHGRTFLKASMDHLNWWLTQSDGWNSVANLESARVINSSGHARSRQSALTWPTACYRLFGERVERKPEAQANYRESSFRQFVFVHGKSPHRSSRNSLYP